MGKVSHKSESITSSDPLNYTLLVPCGSGEWQRINSWDMSSGGTRPQLPLLLLTWFTNGDLFHGYLDLWRWLYFWVVSPCSLVEVYQRFRGPCCLHYQGALEAARTSETLANFYQTPRRYNPEDSHLHTRCCENLKSYLDLVGPAGLLC
jgi:hypothetical protein